MWPELRPLIIVTGSVSFRSEQKKASKDDRNVATVLVAKVKRHLLRIALFETPYGVVVIAERLKELRKLLKDITQEVRDFNATHTACQLDNVLLWEHLEGNRLIAVGSWVQANPEVERVEEALAGAAGSTPSYNVPDLPADATAAVEGPHAPAGLAPATAALHAVGEGDLAVSGGLGSAESGTGETTGTTTFLGHEPEDTPTVT